MSCLTRRLFYSLLLSFAHTNIRLVWMRLMKMLFKKGIKTKTWADFFICVSYYALNSHVFILCITNKQSVFNTKVNMFDSYEDKIQYAIHILVINVISNSFTIAHQHLFDLYGFHSIWWKGILIPNFKNNMDWPRRAFKWRRMHSR